MADAPNFSSARLRRALREDGERSPRSWLVATEHEPDSVEDPGPTGRAYVPERRVRVDRIVGALIPTLPRDDNAPEHPDDDAHAHPDDGLAPWEDTDCIRPDDVVVNRVLAAYAAWREANEGWTGVRDVKAVDQAGRVWQLVRDEHAAPHSAAVRDPRLGRETYEFLLVVGDGERPTDALIEAVGDEIARLCSGCRHLRVVVGHRELPEAWGDSPHEGVLGERERGLRSRGRSASPFVSPAAGRLTSAFGERIHPKSKKRSFHRGIDIANAEGTPVFAAFGGTVRAVRTDSWPGDTRPNPITGTWNTGNFVVIDGPGGGSEWYGHPRKVFVRPGDVVRPGDWIAEMGQTGNVTGPHLHFECWGTRSHASNRNPKAVFDEFGVPVGAPPALPKPGPLVVPAPPKPRGGPDVADQKYLAGLGYYKGAIDGMDGPVWRAGVNAYLKAQVYGPGLVRDGVWGPGARAHRAWVTDLQRALNRWKGSDVAVDGDYGRNTHKRVHEVMVRNHGGLYKGALDNIPGRAFCKMIAISPHPGT